MIRFTSENELKICDATTLRKLASMRRHGVMTDLTLICGTSLYPIHKLVLAASSKHYDQHYFTEKNGQVVKKSSILIPNVEPIDIENLITYMYSGQLVIPENELDGLMRVSNTLKIDGLKEEFGVRVPAHNLVPLKTSVKSAPQSLPRTEAVKRKSRHVVFESPDQEEPLIERPRHESIESEARRPRGRPATNNAQKPSANGKSTFNFNPIMSSTLLMNETPRPPRPHTVEKLKNPGKSVPVKQNEITQGQERRVPGRSRPQTSLVQQNANVSSDVSTILGQSYLDRKMPKGMKMHNESVDRKVTAHQTQNTPLKRGRLGEAKSARTPRQSTSAHAHIRTTTDTAPKEHEFKKPYSVKQTGTGTVKVGPSDSEPNVQKNVRALTPYPKDLSPLKRMRHSERPIPMETKRAQSQPSWNNGNASRVLTGTTHELSEDHPRESKSRRDRNRKPKILETIFSGLDKKLPENVGRIKQVPSIDEKRRREKKKKFDREVDLVVEKKRKCYNTRATKKAQL